MILAAWATKGITVRKAAASILFILQAVIAVYLAFMSYEVMGIGIDQLLYVES